MKKLRNLIAVMAMMGMAAVLTGCGDDDDDDNGGQPQPNPIVAPGTEAELTAQNKIYTAQVNGQAVQLRFPSAGNYELTMGGVTETGTITASRSDNTWTINVTPTAGQQGAREGVLRLTFNAANAGTWEFTPTGGQAETGTFTLTDSNGGGDNGGGDNGGDNGGTPGTDDLTGRTLQINYTGGGGDKFDFTSPTATSWENGTQTGTYQFNQAANNLDVVLGDGQTFDIQLGQGGAVTVNYQATPDAEVQTFAGTYTLSTPQ